MWSEWQEAIERVLGDAFWSSPANDDDDEYENAA